MPTDLRRPNRTLTIRQLCLKFDCAPRSCASMAGLLSPERDGMNWSY